MIATHNTMSYLPFGSIFYRAIWWHYRCQEKSIEEQIADGVRYFDIRVKKDRRCLGKDVNDKLLWKFAYGSATFRCTCDLLEVLDKIKAVNGHFRLIYEGIGATDEYDFRTYLYPIIKREFPRNLDQVVLKVGWTVIKDSEYTFVDRGHTAAYTDKIETLWQWLKHRYAEIKRWAKKNNTPPTEEEIKDENVVYFYDYYNLP